MLQKRLLIDAMLLTSFIIAAGCATTGNYQYDPSRFHRIASNECISFGYVTGSDDYIHCMDKKLRDILPRVMKAARQGDNEARSHALSISLDIANQGDATAMYNVGYMCLEGWGGKHDADVCITWLETAARSGHVRSAKVLSGIYSEGRAGIAPDEKKAAYWSNLPAVKAFAKGESGNVETNDDVVTDPRIGRESQESGSQVAIVDEQLSVQPAAMASETQLEKLSRFEPVIVNVPVLDVDIHMEKIVCRNRVFTGSRFKRKVCTTKAEWAGFDNKNRNKMDQFARELDVGSRNNSGDGTPGHMSR